MNPADILGAALSAPRLTEAACRGLHWMADLDTNSPAETVDRAESICRSCPVLQQCAQWIDQLDPWDRPSGYVAGRLLGVPPPPKLRADPTADDRWLADYMRSRRGRVMGEQVVAAGRAAGIAESRLRAARRRIGATVVAANTAMATSWQLPGSTGEEVAS